MATNPQRAQARQQGYDAFNSGKTERDNPYEVGTEEHAVWLAGWEQGDYDVFKRKRFSAESNMTPQQRMIRDTQQWLRS